MSSLTLSTTGRLQLSVKAKDLKKIAGWRHKSSPFAVVRLLGDDLASEAAPQDLGQTEVVYNCLDPSWTKLFIINNYHFGRPLYIEVAVFDLGPGKSLGRSVSGTTIKQSRDRNDRSMVYAGEDSKGSEHIKQTHKMMGSATFEVNEILGARGNITSKRLKEGGVLYAHIERSKSRGESEIIVFQIRGLGLKNFRSELRAKCSNPFYEIWRREDKSMGAVWNNIYRSHTIKSNLNPYWDRAEIDLEIFCNCDLECSVKFKVWDRHRKSGKHTFMGEFETTVRQFIHSQSISRSHTDRAFSLQRDGKHTGRVVVVEARIIGNEGSQERDAEGDLAGQTANLSIEEGNNSMTEVSQIPSTPSRPQFIDYITSGCEISLVLAVDFSSSNGNPKMPGTPHYVSTQSNDYEKAIYSVGYILSNFDNDKMVPVWGFGCKFDGRIRHCFQVGPEKEVYGVDGMLKAYRSMFKRPLVMSTPCVLTEVITEAAEYATKKYDSARSKGKLSYSVLLILTAGNIKPSDVEVAMVALYEASAAPLSVVIVGIGNADFSEMQILDDFNEGNGSSSGRDITQFVKFNDHTDHNSLSEAVLEEIPSQLEDYFVSKGIVPGAAELYDSVNVPIQPADSRETSMFDSSFY